MENERSSPTGLSQPTADATAAAPLGATPAAKRDYFSIRFVAIYAALILILLGSIAGFVYFAVRPSLHSSTAWSAWKPGSGSVAAVAKQIADHVAAKYRFEDGSQIIAIVPSAPAVTVGESTLAISDVAILSRQTGNANVQPTPAGKAEMYTFCGLGAHCAIATGLATVMRGQLIRREALEIALYTFKYIAAVDSVIEYMPPGPSGGTEALYFQRKDFDENLKQPVAKTLPLSKPPPPTVFNAREAKTIDRLTLPLLFTTTLTELQVGGALLILTPIVL
jgi:hypothetical protein